MRVSAVVRVLVRGRGAGGGAGGGGWVENFDTLRCPGDPGLVSSLLSPLLMGWKRFHSEFTPILPYGRPWRALFKASSWDGARQREFIQCCELA